MSGGRVAWVQLMRVVGSVAVLIIHLAGVVVVSPPLVGSRSWWFATILDSASRWAVPVFVMVSGALMLKSDGGESTGQFLKRRLGRVGIPLLAWVGIYHLWGGYFHHLPTSFTVLMTGFLAGSSYFHLYFLYVMVGLYLITPILRPYIRSARPHEIRNLVIVALIVAMAQTFFNYFMPAVPASVNGLTFFMRYVGYYLAGYYLSTVTLSKRWATLAGFALVATVAIASVGGYQGILNHTLQGAWTYNWEYFSPTVVVMSLSIFVLFQASNTWLQSSPRLMHVIGWIDPLTFGVYLVHPIVHNLLEHGGWGHSINVFGPTPTVGIPVTVLSTFILSLAIVSVGRRAPVIGRVWGEAPRATPSERWGKCSPPVATGAG